MPLAAAQANARIGQFQSLCSDTDRRRRNYRPAGPVQTPSLAELPVHIRADAAALMPPMAGALSAPSPPSAASGWPALALRLLAVSSVVRPMPAAPMVPAGAAAHQEFGLEPAYAIVPDGLATGLADASGALDLAGRMLSAWFADPCTEPDEAFNGLWRIAHPPSAAPPSRFGEARRALDARLVRLLSSPVPEGASSARQVLADTWQSAFSHPVGDWTDFAPQATALRGLVDVDAVVDHAIHGAIAGRESLLGFYDVSGTGVLAANLALLPYSQRAVYQPDVDPAQVEAYRMRVQRLLTRAGMPATEASAQSANIFAMEAVMARAGAGFDRCTLAQAQALVPEWPWARVWHGLGLPPATAVYLTSGFFEQLASLLGSHDAAAWRAFVWLQEARNAERTIEQPRTAASVLQALDSDETAGSALQAVYAGSLPSTLMERAADTFAGLREIFLQAVAVSALSVADQQRMRTRLAALHLDTAHGGRDAGWQGTSVDGSFLANLQALRGSAASAAVATVASGKSFRLPTPPAHHPFAGVGFTPGSIRASPALLDIADRFAAGVPEAWWGMAGSVLGHEIAHAVAELDGLDPTGATLLAAQRTAVVQRIGDVGSGNLRLDPEAAADEALADLRGIRAALLASRAEAEAAGRGHDDAAFFRAAVQTHAAHMTPAQLKARLQDAHPPAPLRARLPAMVEGYQQAFDCDPRPTAPFRDLI